jgi:hypothetical protein
MKLDLLRIVVLHGIPMGVHFRKLRFIGLAMPDLLPEVAVVGPGPALGLRCLGDAEGENGFPTAMGGLFSLIEVTV